MFSSWDGAGALFFDLRFAGCADAEFKTGHRILSRADNRISAWRKKSAEAYLDWPSFSPKRKTARPSALWRTCRAVFL
jgi:hypothetical protein